MKKMKKNQKYNKIFPVFAPRRLAYLKQEIWHQKYQPEQPVQDFQK